MANRSKNFIFSPLPVSLAIGGPSPPAARCVCQEVGSGISAHSLIREPRCYLHLLRFYDGLCHWEQDSSTPVLHIGWAKQMVGCVAKFDPDVRRRAAVSCAAADAGERDRGRWTSVACGQ